MTETQNFTSWDSKVVQPADFMKGKPERPTVLALGWGNL